MRTLRVSSFSTDRNWIFTIDCSRTRYAVTGILYCSRGECARHHDAALVVVQYYSTVVVRARSCLMIANGDETRSFPRPYRFDQPTTVVTVVHVKWGCQAHPSVAMTDRRAALVFSIAAKSCYFPRF